jgi:hypothetical protein
MVKSKLRYMKMLTIFFLVIQGCIPVTDYRHFTTFRTSPGIKSSKLRTDGVYYGEEINSAFRYHLFVLYQDGTYLNLVSTNTDNIGKKIEEKFAQFREGSFAKNIPPIYFWGRFAIHNDTIVIQDFKKAWESLYRDRIRERAGIIKNDSTIVIKSYRYYIKKRMDSFEKPERIENLNLVYKFYKTDYKPDSTNLFNSNNRLKRKIMRRVKKKQ